jgi:hypothetical protein
MYKRRASSPKAVSEEREVGNSAETYSEQASARDAEQHSTPSGSSSVTLAKLELPSHSPTSASGLCKNTIQEGKR